MREIGGYFGLELNTEGYFPHMEGTLVNSGTNAFEYILRQLPNVKRVWIPFYTCFTIPEPLKLLNIPYSFFHVNNHFEMVEKIDLQEDEYILVNNYFGLKDNYIVSLYKEYGDRLIVDSSQSYFAEHLKNCKEFFCPRKFVGVSDGGIAFVDEKVKLRLNHSVSYDRCTHLLKRYDCGANSAYSIFKENGKKLCEQPLMKMSKLTEIMLKNIDYSKVKNARRANYDYLHTKLKNKNDLDLDKINTGVCPLIYPLKTKDVSLRSYLISNKIYCPVYWPNVFDWNKEDSVEYSLSNNVICIPLDQRYDEDDMEYIVNTISDYYK